MKISGSINHGLWLCLIYYRRILAKQVFYIAGIAIALINNNMQLE
jgi:hypothetical protein